MRTIIKIDEDLCNGCGICVTACHEGAIVIENSKAKLIRDDYCDGLGNCLPGCPTGAITFEERETLEYDQAAVDEHLKTKSDCSGGCPGTAAYALAPEKTVQEITKEESQPSIKAESRLMQWPVQIKLVPVNAPYFENANLLIAADCTAFAYASFHEDFIKNHITVIGCPKLDEGDYADKLSAIIKNNQIKSLKIVRMEVPCCGGIEHAAVTALKNSGKMIPWQVVTITSDGKIKEI